MRRGAVRRFAAGSPMPSGAVDPGPATGPGEAGTVASRLRAASRATTMPTAPEAPRIAAGLIPAPAARAPTSAAMTPPTEKVAWKADMTGRL